MRPTFLCTDHARKQTGHPSSSRISLPNKPKRDSSQQTSIPFLKLLKSTLPMLRPGRVGPEGPLEARGRLPAALPAGSQRDPDPHSARL